jgi:hypothetical protein
MRSADNFNPEWGYLAPRPSFLRSARIALVATAIGATSGGAVVYALLELPSPEQTSVAARTLVHSPESALAGAMAVTAPAPVQAAIPVQPHIAASAGGAGPAEPRSSKAMPTTVQAPTGVAALAEAPVATASPPTGDTAATASAAPVSSPPAQRKVVRQQRATWPNVPRQQAFMFPYGGSSRAPAGLLPSGGFWQRGDD